MSPTEASSFQSPAPRPPAPATLAPPCGIVLAGGEGMRLRPLTRYICGDERPKQFAPLFGARSLLRHTLDRIGRQIPPARTVVVTQRDHAPYLAEGFAGAPWPHILAQPADRGTAAGILLPAHWVAWRDPRAVVAVFPSDHFVLGELAFMAHVMAVADFVRHEPHWVVLLGAVPSYPEPQYGWIEPGEELGQIGVEPVRRVRRFWEKPSAAAAAACCRRGGLWNTLVLVGMVNALIELGRRALPALSAQLAGIRPFAGTADEPRALQEAYALAASANFSQAVLETCPASLAVSRLPSVVTWSDLGTPERVLASLRGAGIVPPWFRGLDGAAVALKALGACVGA